MCIPSVLCDFIDEIENLKNEMIKSKDEKMKMKPANDRELRTQADGIRAR